MATGELSSRGWPGKLTAALLPGLSLSFALSGLIALALLGSRLPDSGTVQLVMWSISPLWVAIIGTCFLFRTPLRAWLWLGLGNILAFGLLAVGHWVIG